MLTKIRVVLVNPSHGGNVGATARAIKNMGLSRLVLVSPTNHLGDEARSRASGADDVLEGAHVVTDVSAGLAGATWVVGTTARRRRLDLERVTPRQLAVRARDECAHGEVAILFGRERMGLTNEELQRCHAVVEIPANPDYSSLNVAAAVQIISYELRLAALASTPNSVVGSAEPVEWVDAQALEGFYAHLEKALRSVGFFEAGNAVIVMRRLRRLFSRSRLDQNEFNILRGFLRAILAKVER